MGRYFEIAKSIKRSPSQNLINALILVLGCVCISLYVGSIHFQGVPSKILLLSFILILVSIVFLLDYFVIKSPSNSTMKKSEIRLYFGLGYASFFILLVAFSLVLFLFWSFRMKHNGLRQNKKTWDNLSNKFKLLNFWY